MLGMDRAYVIKHKWHHEGRSIRQIAGDLEVSRNTVRKAGNILTIQGKVRVVSGIFHPVCSAGLVNTLCTGSAARTRAECPSCGDG